jgi:hypothetical protein
MVAGSAAEIEHSGYRGIPMPLKYLFDDVAFGGVVLVPVEGVIAFGIVKPEGVAQESTSRTALHTCNNWSSVNAKPEGK